ncbi:hypothetical protein BDV93DRAFT_337024 [Ceratobasidium sp. AG-I]|nr:hypothetical protein BDV93DRAFT_337024 [Ceratobasidium sp. AG-I]
MKLRCTFGNGSYSCNECNESGIVCKVAGRGFRGKASRPLCQSLSVDKPSEKSTPVPSASNEDPLEISPSLSSPPLSPIPEAQDNLTLTKISSTVPLTSQFQSPSAQDLVSALNNSTKKGMFVYDDYLERRKLINLIYKKPLAEMDILVLQVQIHRNRRCHSRQGGVRTIRRSTRSRFPVRLGAVLLFPT